MKGTCSGLAIHDVWLGYHSSFLHSSLTLHSSVPNHFSHPATAETISRNEAELRLKARISLSRDEARATNFFSSWLLMACNVRSVALIALSLYIQYRPFCLLYIGNGIYVSDARQLIKFQTAPVDKRTTRAWLSLECNLMHSRSLPISSHYHLMAFEVRALGWHGVDAKIIDIYDGKDGVIF